MRLPIISSEVRAISCNLHTVPDDWPMLTREMLSPQVNIGVNWDCGLAFNIVQSEEMTIIGHPGWNVGFHCIMLGCLEAGQGLIWMTNGENGRRLGFEVSHGLAEVVKWSWWS